MKQKGWDVVVISLPEYEHVVVEIYFDSRLVMTLDKEDATHGPSVALFADDGPIRVNLRELRDNLELAREELLK